MLKQTIGALWRPLILLSAGLISLFSAATVFAQSPHFGMRPQDPTKGYFEYKVAPGSHIEDVLVVNNPSDAPVTLNVQVVRGMTAGNGGITFGPDTSGSAQWVNLRGVTTLEMPAKSSKALPFEVNVPADAQPGEYVAGFLAQLAEAPQTTQLAVAEAGKTSFQVKVVSKLGVAVVLQVAEPTNCAAVIPSLEASSSSGRWLLSVGLQNTGNRHFKASGDVVARPVGGGDPIAETKFAVGYFIPGDSITYPVALEPYPQAGDYQIDVNLRTDCGYATSFTRQVSVSDTNVKQAAEEVRSESQSSAQSSAVADEAARLQAQAQLIQSIAFLVGGVAVLVIAVVVVVLVFRRRRTA